MKPHGTHATFNRHKKRGEKPCDRCIGGERTYQRNRARDRRHAARQVDGQAPLMASVPPLPQLAGLPVTPRFLDSEQAAQIAVAILRGLPGMAVSFTREHGLRLHVDPAIADDWITAAPMADDEPLADVHHLPARWTA